MTGRRSRSSTRMDRSRALGPDRWEPRYPRHTSEEDVQPGCRDELSGLAAIASNQKSFRRLGPSVHAAVAAATGAAGVGLNSHSWRLMGSLLARVAEGVVQHLGQPGAETLFRGLALVASGKGGIHDPGGGDLFSMGLPAAAANR